MSGNKEDLKNKIIYRASYRGTKEMDILMTKFVKSVIDQLDASELEELNILVNANDEKLIELRDKESDYKNLSKKILKKFKDFSL